MGSYSFPQKDFQPKVSVTGQNQHRRRQLSVASDRHLESRVSQQKLATYAHLLPAYKSVTAGERWGTHTTFRVYPGWITVATIANPPVVF